MARDKEWPLKVMEFYYCWKVSRCLCITGNKKYTHSRRNRVLVLCRTSDRQKKLNWIQSLNCVVVERSDLVDKICCIGIMLLYICTLSFSIYQCVSIFVEVILVKSKLYISSV